MRQPAKLAPCVFALAAVVLWVSSSSSADLALEERQQQEVSSPSQQAHTAAPIPHTDPPTPAAANRSKTPLSFFASDAFSGFPQELLSRELESLSPQSHSLLLFDEHECGFDAVGEWHREALQGVYDERLMRLSRAMNMDIYSQDVWSYQSDYACVLLAEKRHTEWRQSNSMPPSRVLVVVQRGREYAGAAESYMRTGMPGIASCDMAEVVWDQLMYENGTIPGDFFWLLNYMTGWDCDVVVDLESSLQADWYQQYDMVFTMSWFVDEDSSEWHFHCEEEGWTNPWLSRQQDHLQHHSPVIFVVPHEPRRYCGGLHVPPSAPHCPVFLDSYGCMDQPPHYWHEVDSRGPRSLSTIVSYHYAVQRVQKQWYSDAVEASVILSAHEHFPANLNISDWLADAGFDVDSSRELLCRPPGTCSVGMYTSKPQELYKMAVQKYGILETRGRQSSGQLIAELSMLGVPVFSLGPKLFHRLLQHPFLHCADYEELKRKIVFLETNPHLYEQLRAYIARRLPFIDLVHLPQPYHLAARAQTVLRHTLQSHKLDMFDKAFVSNRTALDRLSRLCSVRP